MARKCGFTLNVPFAILQANGFAAVTGKRSPTAFDLWTVRGRVA
jgi:hypothetical protein